MLTCIRSKYVLSANTHYYDEFMLFCMSAHEFSTLNLYSHSQQNIDLAIKRFFNIVSLFYFSIANIVAEGKIEENTGTF